MENLPWLLIYVVAMGLVLLGVGRIIEWRWRKLRRTQART
jgi:hypothetical protein